MLKPQEAGLSQRQQVTWCAARTEFKGAEGSRGGLRAPCGDSGRRAGGMGRAAITRGV